MTDAPTEFAMRGARSAIDAGLKHIEEQVQAIERAVSENPGLAFDLARNLIESACRTILTERGVVFSKRDALPKLFKAVTTRLPLLPAGASQDGRIRRSLSKTLGGLSTAVQGVVELRNAYGFASHGSDRERPPMEAAQALLAASTADSIVDFLYRVHCQDRPTPVGRASYDDNQSFNDYVDGAHASIRIFELVFRPSEVLYQMEPESYRIFLAEHGSEGSETEEASS